MASEMLAFGVMSDELSPTGQECAGNGCDELNPQASDILEMGVTADSTLLNRGGLLSGEVSALKRSQNSTANLRVCPLNCYCYTIKNEPGVSQYLL